MEIHLNIHPEVENTFPATRGNAISKAYYDFLLGEINRGTMKKAVCRFEYPQFNYISYHLISSAG